MTSTPDETRQAILRRRRRRHCGPCPIDENHEWHGLPSMFCPGPFRVKPKRDVPERVPCTRCSTGLPVEHTCRQHHQDGAT